ncbi:hypothetical protein Tco_0245838 [Tanacetum coccineum]
MSNSIPICNSITNAFIMLSWKRSKDATKCSTKRIKWAAKTVPVAKGSSETTTKRYMENYKNVSQDIRDQLNAEAEAVQIILTGIDDDIYSTVDACPNACEVHSYFNYNQKAKVVTLVKQIQELKTSSLHKLYEVLEQQQIYHHQNHPTQNTSIFPPTDHNNLLETRKSNCYHKSSAPTYDPEPETVTEDDEMSKDKEIDKLTALISLLFKKIYKPTNNNLRTSSNTSRANQDNSTRINIEALGLKKQKGS